MNLRLFSLVIATAIGLVCVIHAAPARAQVAPDASELARYTGLHIAAHRGDVAAIDKLIAGKADVNARDGYGRTPLHVAAFAKQRDAIRALAKAGANLGLLERDL